MIVASAMIILTGIKDGETTRFVIGCADAAEKIEAALTARGYDVGVCVAEPPDRPHEEQLRASRIIAEMFGH